MKLLLMIAVVAFFSACRRDEEISHVRTPKEEEPGPEMSGGMASSASEAAIPEPGEPATRLKWTAPSGWKELPGNGIRAATLVPPGDAGLEATIVALPGDVGQELPNVNRWRGQIGLPPVDEEGVIPSRTTVKAPVGTVMLYDFTGPGVKKTRMLAAIVKTPGTTWFFKMSGDAPGVGAARASFVGLLEGLREAK